MSSNKQSRQAVLRRYIERLEAKLGDIEALDQRFFWARVFTLLVGGAVTLLALFYGRGGVTLAVLGAFILAFSVVVTLHRRMERARRKYRFARSYAGTQLARMNLHWGGIPNPPDFVLDGNHPFASDLNLVGERSMHQLIDTATSHGGSQRLLDWLLEPSPDPERILYRQRVLREMLPLSGLRDHLGLKGMMVKKEAKGQWQGEGLLDWLEKSSSSRSDLPVLILMFALALTNISLFLLNALGTLPAYWPVSLTIYAAIYFYKYGDIKDIFEDAYTIGKSLEQFKVILAYLERYPYPEGGELRQLCAPFREGEKRPSSYLRRLTLITSAVSLGNNQVFSFVLNAVLPWNLFFAHLLRGYKTALRASLQGWLDTWYELEAFTSLANFAHLNPAYTFPEIATTPTGAEEPLFEARELGHPLLSDEARVCNDFSFERLGEIAIVTGSNMSGKSTFLRTLGVNLCLGYAGGVVNAASLCTGLFRIYTCIEVSDSLSYGISYFYAEVRRLKGLLEAIKADDPYPVFFLIDEIYRGTNNRERRIGSQAYVRALTGSRSAGAISTHDLELVKLADQGKNIRNFHFREDIRDGRMAFDYRLRPGPCPTTNALRIMEMEGLPFEPEMDIKSL